MVLRNDTAAARVERPTPVRDLGPAWLWLLGGVAAACSGLMIGLFLGGSAYQPAPTGLPDAGPLVGWGLPIAKFLTVAAATLTLGFLTTAAFLMPSADRTLVSRMGRADLVRASVCASVWSLGALLTLAFTHATVLGKPLLEAIQPSLFLTYAFEIGQNIAYAFTAVVAAIIAVCAALTVRTGSAALLTGAGVIGLIAAPMSAHGTSLGDHSLAMTSGSVHALAAALWVGGLIVMTRHAWRHDPGLGVAIKRFSILATVCVAALVLSGIANAYTRLEEFSDLVTTAYGVLVLLKVALISILALVALQSRKAAAAAPETGTRLVQWLLTEALLLAVTIGVAVSMTLTAYPRADVPLATPAEELLGFPFPPPPTFSSVAVGWYPDAVFLLLATVLGAGYGVGVWKARRRGVHWPWGRTIAWFFGVATLVWATSSGIGGYAKVSVEWHMIEHMVLAMVVPILLVLGMPVTLALRALRPAAGRDRGPREWLLWGLHSAPSKIFTHPVYVLAVATFGLFGLYLSPLFGAAMGSHVGHILMGLHFLLAGFLFFWVVLGLDPGPRQVPAWARLVLLLVFVSLHGFFAVVMMMSAQPLGQEWFAAVQPPWISNLVTDSVSGGGVAWAFGDIPTLVVVIVVCIQWARTDDRIARRIDRQADRDGGAELADYNARLATMARRAEHGSQHRR